MPVIRKGRALFYCASMNIVDLANGNARILKT
jgi:hypothetical protein